jgi:hypothetical protein
MHCLDAAPLLPFDPELESAFRAYHAANPQVYAKLREFALAAKRAGRQRLGINALHERVRWYTAVEAQGDEWRLNNNYRPYYARLLMLQEPQLRGFFELRTAKADEELSVAS